MPTRPPQAESPPSAADDPLGPNPLRLTGRQWLVALAIAGLLLTAVPAAWNALEPFDPGPDYRLPYALSEDYPLHERHLTEAAARDPGAVILFGDSVVWGEYVERDGTLSAFLGGADPGGQTFINGGINGLYPLALDGLARHYGSPLGGRKVIVHLNLLWLSSPEADLSSPKPRPINHESLVPPFGIDVPSHHADLSTRTATVVRHRLPWLRWVRHLQVTRWEGASLPDWTLADDGGYPPAHPNATRNPLAGLRLGVPGEPADDPDRGPGSPRHRPWFEGGRRPQSFDWVPLDDSVQWQAFRRLVRHLDRIGSDLLVIVGPLNTHMIADDARPPFEALVDGTAAWLADRGIPVVRPATLPSDRYADASHPLTDGYRELAGALLEDPEFTAWLDR